MDNSILPSLNKLLVFALICIFLAIVQVPLEYVLGVFVALIVANAIFMMVTTRGTSEPSASTLKDQQKQKLKEAVADEDRREAGKYTTMQGGKYY